MDPLLIIAIVVPVLLLAWLTATYNRFSQLRNLVRESWSGIDISLQRRHDLIPNLVETVRAYMSHEREVLERVISLRDSAVAMHDPARLAREESALVAGLNQIFMRSEAYPQLKASESFLSLQRELANTEDRIAAARRFYNANVRDYNTMLASFPSSLVGSARGLKPLDFFEIDSLEVRLAPTLSGRASQKALG